MWRKWPNPLWFARNDVLLGTALGALAFLGLVVVSLAVVEVSI